MPFLRHGAAPPVGWRTAGHYEFDFRSAAQAVLTACPLPSVALPPHVPCPVHCLSWTCPLPFVACPLPFIARPLPVHCLSLPFHCLPTLVLPRRSLQVGRGGQHRLRGKTPPSLCCPFACALPLHCPFAAFHRPPPLPSCNPFTLPIPHRCRWRPSWASACMSARCRFCTAFHTAARSVNGPHTSPPPCCLTALPRCFTAFQCPLKRLRMLNRVGSTCTSPPCPSRRCSSTWTTIRQHRPITQPCPSGCPDEHHAFSLRVFVEIQRTHREIVGVSRPRHTT